MTTFIIFFIFLLKNPIKPIRRRRVDQRWCGTIGETHSVKFDAFVFGRWFIFVTAVIKTRETGCAGFSRALQTYARAVLNRALNLRDRSRGRETNFEKNWRRTRFSQRKRFVLKLSARRNTHGTDSVTRCTARRPLPGKVRGSCGKFPPRKSPTGPEFLTRTICGRLG